MCNLLEAYTVCHTNFIDITNQVQMLCNRAFSTTGTLMEAYIRIVPIPSPICGPDFDVLCQIDERARQEVPNLLQMYTWLETLNDSIREHRSCIDTPLVEQSFGSTCLVSSEYEIDACLESLTVLRKRIDPHHRPTAPLECPRTALADKLDSQLRDLDALLHKYLLTINALIDNLSEIKIAFFETFDNTAAPILSGGSRGGGGSYVPRSSDIQRHNAADKKAPTADAPQIPELDHFGISAVTPRSIKPGDYGIVDVVLYEDAFRGVIDQVLAEQEHGGKETLGGAHAAAKGTPIRVVLSSPDVTIDEPEETQVWQGKYLRFSFDFAVPEEYTKRQVLLRAAVYFADVPATRLRILINLAAPAGQQPAIERCDIRSAFMSYATVEREKVIRIMQGIQQVRPDLDLFLDVDSLHSGENWKARLYAEIDRRDVLYLCWSRAARDSQYVTMEWQYALRRKGIDGIEPIPLEPAENCPPPSDLDQLHFGNRLLFIIRNPEA